MITYERLRTPAGRLDALIDPPPGEIMTALNAPHPPQAALLDTDLATLRSRLAARFDLPSRVVLTGHQAEFFHAGVFAKRIATAVLRRACGAGEVYLSVDSDTPRGDRLDIPVITADGRVERRGVPIPGCNPALPVEDQPRVALDEWRRFFQQVDLAAGRHEFLETYAEAWLKRHESGDPAEAFIAGNCAVEAALGFPEAVQLRVSKLSETPEFRAFAAHLLLNANRFRDDYNAAQRAYRIRRKVRNPARPAPPLAKLDQRVESAFWLQRPGEPRRRLFVEEGAGQLRLYADRELVGRESLDEFARLERHERPWSLAGGGWRVRPRALALSGFCRLALCDVFVHGIGGAKYDEMTADFMQRFLGSSLGQAACVTATLRLPLPDGGARARDLSVLDWRVRDAKWNPQRHADLPVELSDEFNGLLDEQRRLTRERREDRAARRAMHQRWRDWRNRCAGESQAAMRRLQLERELLQARCDSDAAARDREYFYALAPQESLRNLQWDITNRFQTATT